MSNENRGWLKANFGVRRFVPAVWAGTSNPVMREIERDAKPLGGSFVRHEDYAELQGVAVEVWRISDEKSARIRELDAELREERAEKEAAVAAEREACADLAYRRARICDDAWEKTQDPSERCAALEARHIARTIRARAGRD